MMAPMKLFDRLERKIGRFAVPHVTAMVVLCQVLAYTLKYANPTLIEAMDLIPARVFDGEAWRLVTFLFLPPKIHPILVLFFWYLFFLMGTALEQLWGDFRYNVFLLIGWLATVGVSFLTPDEPAFGIFLQSSVFLAFAYLFPDFRLMLFFLLPVKIKWLALLEWLCFGFMLVAGPLITQLQVLAAVSNFLLFFGRDILLRMRIGRRKMAAQAERIAPPKKKPLHCCRVCGITEQSNPENDFRYCSKCVGACCYCQEHLRNHEHVAAIAKPEPTPDRIG
jgi:hypothetical protein